MPHSCIGKTTLACAQFYQPKNMEVNEKETRRLERDPVRVGNVVCEKY
jgi:hypothetical protein